ncbi:MAG: NDP-sugar synthase [Nitrospinae bacterium]|nr:NDP-sugar synthase [Nitrospinota bacterium]
MNVMIVAADHEPGFPPHTRQLPKPLFPILDQTLLEIALATARKAAPGVVVVYARKGGDIITRFLASRGVEERVEVAGNMAEAARWLGGGDFAAINTDAITEVDWAALETAHHGRDARSTYMLRYNADPRRYVALCMDGECRITRVGDTPGAGYDEEQELLMLASVAIHSSEVLEAPEEEWLAPRLTDDAPLFGWRSELDWAGAASANDYLGAVMGRLADHPMEEGLSARLKHVFIRPPVYVSRTAIVRAGAIIGPYAAISDGASLGACAWVTNSVIMPRSTIRSGSAVNGEIL